MESYRQMAYGPIDDEDREYTFSAGNPFLGNPETLALASDLFARVRECTLDLKHVSDDMDRVT